MIDLLELTQKLVSIPSPTGQEREICDFIEGWIRQELPGVPFSRSRQNLIVCPPQQGGRPVIGLFGHIDTVPPRSPTAARSPRRSALRLRLFRYEERSGPHDGPPQGVRPTKRRFSGRLL